MRRPRAGGGEDTSHATEYGSGGLRRIILKAGIAAGEDEVSAGGNHAVSDESVILLQQDHVAGRVVGAWTDLDYVAVGDCREHAAAVSAKANMESLV